MQLLDDKDMAIFRCFEIVTDAKIWERGMKLSREYLHANFRHQFVITNITLLDLLAYGSRVASGLFEESQNAMVPQKYERWFGLLKKKEYPCLLMLSLWLVQTECKNEGNQSYGR